MRRLYVSSVFRRPNSRGKEGKIYVLDYESKEILHIEETSGIRGLCFHEGVLWVAGFNNTLMNFNLETAALEKVREYSELSYLHLIYSREGLLWATSTGNDSIVKLSNAAVREVIPVTTAGKDTLHFNSIGWAPNGDQYHVYNATRQIVNFTTGELFIEGPRGMHDIYFLDEDRFIVNASDENRALLVSLGEKNSYQTLHQSEKDGPSTSENNWGFSRGLAVSEDLIFLGSSPVDLHVFNRQLRKMDSWRLSSSPEESVYDICLHPQDWEIDCGQR